VSATVTDALGQQSRERYEVRVVSAVTDESQSSGVELSGAGGGGLAGGASGGYVSYASDGDSLLFSGIDKLYLSNPGSDSLALAPSDVEAGLERVSEQNIQRSCSVGTTGNCAGQRDVTVSGEAADVLADQLDINPSGLRTSFTAGGIDTEALDQELGAGSGDEKNTIEENDNQERSGPDDIDRNPSSDSSNGWSIDSPAVDWNTDNSNSDSGDDVSSDSSASSSGSGWSTDSSTANWDVGETDDSDTSDSGDSSGGSDSGSGSSESNSDSSSGSSDDGGGGGCNFDWYC
jgi:hypothetical protein